MSELPPELGRQLAQQYSIERFPPIVRFYDHAIRDDVKSEACGRERFKAAIYIEKTTRKSTIKEVFSRRMLATDKKDYAREWAEYLERHEAFANRKPPLDALPGLDVVSHAELKALGLTDCEKVAEYPGDLFELEPFRATAKKIMEISDGLREQRTNHREERQEVQAGLQRPLYSAGSPAADGSSEENTFTYTFKVA